MKYEGYEWAFSQFPRAVLTGFSTVFPHMRKYFNREGRPVVPGKAAIRVEYQKTGFCEPIGRVGDDLAYLALLRAMAARHTSVCLTYI